MKLKCNKFFTVLFVATLLLCQPIIVGANIRLDFLDQPVPTEETVFWVNTQVSYFSGFRADWSAGAGYFKILNSGITDSEISLFSTGDQIFIQVPIGAYRGQLQIVVRHGNQFSITDLYIRGHVDMHELIGIGVGVSNAVSQVMIGDYIPDLDDDGNPIVIPPDGCPEGEFMNEEGECESSLEFDVEPDADMPVFDTCPEGEFMNEDDECESSLEFDVEPDADMPVFDTCPEGEFMNEDDECESSLEFDVEPDADMPVFDTCPEGEFMNYDDECESSLEFDVEPDGMMPMFPEVESDDTFYHLSPEGMTPTMPVVTEPAASTPDTTIPDTPKPTLPQLGLSPIFTVLPGAIFVLTGTVIAKFKR